MIIKEIAQQISEGFSDHFKIYDFKFKKSTNEFFRKTDKVTQIFSMLYTKVDDYITITPELIIHIKDIEDIYKSIAQIKGRPYLTLGNNFLTLADYDGDDANYKKKPSRDWLVENDDDIKYLIKIIPSYLEKDILPYFEKNSSIERVDELLNAYPDKMSIHNYGYPLRANIAIIAAKLNNNPRYDDLVSIYETEIEDVEENYKIEFYKLKQLLSSEDFDQNYKNI